MDSGRLETRSTIHSSLHSDPPWSSTVWQGPAWLYHDRRKDWAGGLGRWCCAAFIISDGDSRPSWTCHPILSPVASIQAASPGGTDNPGRAQGNKVGGWGYAEPRGVPGLSITPCLAPPHPQVITGWPLCPLSPGEGHIQTEGAVQGRRGGPLREESVEQKF